MTCWAPRVRCWPRCAGRSSSRGRSIIEQNGREVGHIQKRWSGFGKEMFTDADNFGVTFENVRDPRLRTLVVAATFLLDFVHFENRGG